MHIIEDEDSCWLWDKYDFWHPRGTVKKDGKHRIPSQIAWEIACGPVPTGMEVCHTCDRPPCVRLKHLFLATHKENMLDRDRKGRGVALKGQVNGRAKLTEVLVQQMRAEYIPGITTQIYLANKYGVSRSVAHRVVKLESWRHVA